MSYRGRPSKGCEACRARKIKCDEAKPKCTRCARSGQECQYRDQTDLLFRNQTASAAQRAEVSWRRRSKSHQRALSEGSVSHISATSDNNIRPMRKRTINELRPRTFGSTTPEKSHGTATVATPTRTRSPDTAAISPTIKQDMLRLAYERFVYDFVASEDPNRPPDEPSDALFSFVPLLYQHADPNSCLTAVVNAVAYINFANRCHAPLAATLAEESFGEGIRILSGILTDTEKAASNDALCSVHLMGVFETLTNFQRHGTFAAHQDGANALLQLRTPEQYYENPVSARLYEVAYAQMLLANLQAAKFPSMAIQDKSSVRKDRPSLFDESCISVVRLIWKEAQLHAVWHEVKQSATPPASRYDLHDLLQAALILNSDYAACEDTLPAAWSYEVEPNTPEAQSRYSWKWQKLVLISRGAPLEIHAYSNLRTCSMWGYFRTSRMFLLRDLLEILNWVFRLPDLRPSQSSQSVRPTLEQIFGPDWEINHMNATTLDDVTLRTYQSSAISSLVNILEKSCSLVLSSFTVPMYKKSIEDVMGIRGHIVLWSLGTMDSILSSGLVPDSNVSPSRMDTPSSSPTVRSSRQSISSASGAHTSPFYHDTSTTEHGLYHVPPPLEYQPSAFLPPPSRTGKSTLTTPPLSGGQAKIAHPFDSTPRYPYDTPIDPPGLGPNLAEHKGLDVSAKREWLNSMLYYIGTELGIKKALAVPAMEGYIPIVKPRVDSILGL